MTLKLYSEVVQKPSHHIKPFVIYAYRLTSDSGNAPCIHDLYGNTTGMLTLACCKGGQIRGEKGIGTGLRYAIGKMYKDAIDNKQINVYLMGIFKKTLLYFANITKITTMEDYCTPGSQYEHRKDCIYHFARGKFKRNSRNPSFHPKNDLDQHRRDWLGKYVLLSTHFAYWGKDSRKLPENLLQILPKFRESKSYTSESSEGKQIMRMIINQWNIKDIIQNEPHCSKKTHRCKGCAIK